MVYVALALIVFAALYGLFGPDHRTEEEKRVDDLYDRLKARDYTMSKMYDAIDGKDSKGNKYE